MKSLAHMTPGTRGKVVGMDIDQTMKSRLVDMGISCGTEIECVGISPLGDPIAFKVRGAVIAIRRRDCRNITVSEEMEHNEHEKH